MNTRLMMFSAVALGCSTSAAHADFIKDSKASLDLRNFYLNQDQRQSNAPHKAEEWVQGFQLRFESGYTGGPVGVGVDAIGLLGLKLDSSPDRATTGLLKRGSDGRAKDEYGELGLTAKVRVSRTTLKSGTLQPKVPVVQINDSRLQPQLFRGTWLNSAQVEGLSLDAARLEKVNQRDSSDYEDLQLNTGVKRNVRVTGSPTANHFDFAGGTYQWNKSLSTSYYYGNLENFYRQHFLALQYQVPLSDKSSLKADLRWADSNGGSASNIDNQVLNGMLTYRNGGHALGLGYQQMKGETGFATIRGADPYLVNFVQISDFANKDEKSWQVRYDYDFASLGIPGLTFMTRYLYGSDIDTLLPGGSGNGRERERDMDLGYVIQSGPLKNLGIKWRNAALRSNFDRAIDENRLIVSYSLPLW
ncbi:OprD family porin [Pseudomonas entomophila]|uniref:OprD family porin n=1 Tax=Pseudomonas entomophila TaxID=312306 RepID=UPI0023D7FE06|nr:OprD family porin [Pseudomonas entomophila]MDF0732763.1 OprD family porin [Pseudomonas entomophila]